MSDATCVRQCQDKIFMVGNLKKKEKILDASFKKAFLPWEMSVYDLNSDPDGEAVDEKLTITRL
jgi:hypothetical protein